jgi:hypothetical protein
MAGPHIIRLAEIEMVGRPKGKAAIVLAIVSAMMGSAPAGALSPATPEQLLCNSSYIFLGQVVTASNRDAGKDPKSFAKYATRNTVDLSIVVKELVGIASPTSQQPPGPVLSPGDTIEAATIANTLPWSVSRHGGNGRLYFQAPVDAILPNDLIEGAYVGEDFIFSSGTPRPGKRHYVLVWPADKKSWALKTMAQAQLYAVKNNASWHCPAPSTGGRAAK